MTSKYYPFALDLLTPLEANLLQRTEVLEAMVHQLLRVVGETLPSTSSVAQQISQQLAQGSNSANERSAAVFLARRKGEDLLDPEEGSQEANVEITKILDTYFPTMQGHPHPLRLLPEALVPKEVSKLSEEPMPAMKDIEEHGHGFASTALLSPNDQPQTALFIDGETLSGRPRETARENPNTLVIDPQTAQWVYLCPITEGADRRFFFHHQSQFVETSALDKALYEQLVKPLNSKVRGYFKSNADAAITLTTLTMKIHAAEPVMSHVLTQEGLYNVVLSSGHHDHLGRTIMVSSDSSPLKLLLSEKYANQYLIAGAVNDALMTANLEDLPPQSINLLIEWLKALTKVTTKPSKTRTKH